MKKNLSLDQMQITTGGDVVSAACAGFASVFAVYRVGLLFNWWNPVGQTAAVIGTVVTVGCLVYNGVR